MANEKKEEQKTYPNWDKLNKTRIIDFESGQFEANGTIYYLETTLTVARFCEFQILEKELALGMGLKDFVDGQKKLRDLLNQQRFVDCAVLVTKLMEHSIVLNHKEPIILKLCSLFINTENEDRSMWNNDLVVKKLNDWKASDIAYKCFFDIAVILVPGYIDLYNVLTQHILELGTLTKEMITAMQQL